MDTDTQSRATRGEQNRDNGASLCPTFPLRRHEELSMALEPLTESFGEYEQFVVRMSFALRTLKQVCLLSGLYYHRSGLNTLNTRISYI